MTLEKPYLLSPKPNAFEEEEAEGPAREEEAPQGTLSETTTTPPSKQKNVKAYIETKKLKFKKGSRKNTAGKRSGFTSKRSSPAKFPYQLKIGSFDGTETFRFNTKHIGGEVHFHESSL